jgi:predicted peroxiredoxin
MSDYLLVETQGSWAGPGCDRFLGDAAALAAGGHGVWLFLAQDGVLAAATEAATAPGSGLRRLVEQGVTVWVDRFSLEQRALPAEALPAGVATVDMAPVAAKLLEPGVRAVWH